MGGWIILLLAGSFVAHFAWPLFEGIAHASQDQPTEQFASDQSARLAKSSDLGDQIAAAALARTKHEVSYDPAYYKISYPGGDIPADKGTHTDVIIRTLRAVDFDLQQLIHEDMKGNFLSYPQLWSAKEPDPNIDHRRIENIARYLERNHSSLPTTRDADDYGFGDIIIWRFPQGRLHIGIVVPGPGSHAEEKWVVHNLDSTPKWEDALLDYHISGHYRFEAPAK